MHKYIYTDIVVYNTHIFCTYRYMPYKINIRVYKRLYENLEKSWNLKLSIKAYGNLIAP